MDQILKQVGELLLNAVPTAILLLIVYVLYHLIVYKPLGRVLAERHEKTEGAIQKARADIAAAEARTAEYEQRLREAKAALFKAQETRRAQAQEVRTRMLAEARGAADAKVKAARSLIQSEAEGAKSMLPAEAERLAAEIMQAVLRTSQYEQSPASGGRP